MRNRPTYGGQAVIEGVMIRGQHNVCVAVRRPDGSVAIRQQPLSPLFTGAARRLPLVRGVIALAETLSGAAMALMMAVSLTFAVGVFFLAPLFASEWLEGLFDSALYANIAEGVIRLVFFLVYIVLIGRMNDIRRVFMYHGAEHMTVHAQERGDPLEVAEISKYSTAHPRCGTAFLLVVMVVSAVAFVFVGREPLWWLVASRVVLIPVIAAVSYELIRLSGMFAGNPLVGLITGPSLALQRLTTREPTDDQIEIAIEAMRLTLEADASSPAP